MEGKDKRNCLLLPAPVREAIDLLESWGWEAWAVGGCVRDSLLGKSPEDWDLCTSANPHQILSCFSGFPCNTVGMRHGTIGVKYQGERLEITTFRTEGNYGDFRHPDQVTFTASITQDLARRDFTVNAMAYHPGRGIVDPFGGREDLLTGVLRCVGEPSRRFREDALRMFRGVRFCAQLGMEMEPGAWEAALSLRELLTHVSSQRIRVEWAKLLDSPGAWQVLQRYWQIPAVWIPSLRSLRDTPQAYETMVQSMKRLEGPGWLRMALLLCWLKQRQGFLAVGREGLLAGLGYPKQERMKIEQLVEFCQPPLKPDRKEVAGKLGLLGKDQFHYLLQLQMALYPDSVSRLEKVRQTMEEIFALGLPVTKGQLAVKGEDLAALGYGGKRIGEVLAYLLEQAGKGNVPNERQALLKMAKQIP